MTLRIASRLLASLTVWGGLAGLSAPTSVRAAEPVKIILDTDMGFDCDDAAAVAILHNMADHGECEILAMGVCSGGENQKWGPACLDAVNTYHGRPDVPIGLGRNNQHDDKSKFSRQVAEAFPHDLPSGDKLPEANTVYRKALADAADGSVTFVSIGYLTNVPQLLASPGDEISPLTGKALVAQKVKRWVCMAGGYPKGREWNFYADPAASIAALRDWPTPIVFSGFEIGNEVRTGAGYDQGPKENPARLAYELHVGAGKAHGSWDQTAVLYAVRENRDAIWKLSENGRPAVDEQGDNTWKSDPAFRHQYLVLTDAKTASRVIDEMMMTEPGEAKQTADQRTAPPASNKVAPPVE